ncbi:MAG: CoA-binding protein [Treponema sp.]|nr:CoA-binding protein [Treponema sp.]
MAGISGPSRERLLHILRILEAGAGAVLTSAELETLSGWPSHTIRKDISCLGEPETPGEDPAGEAGTALGGKAGYNPEALAAAIRGALGLDRRRAFCVVGLGRLGSAFLNTDWNTGGNGSGGGGFELAAGFDTNVNRVEILKSPAPLYPAYKMAGMISRLGIELALLCVPAGAAQASAEKLAAAGIRGIVNFAPATLTLPAGVTVQNVYVIDQLRALAVKMNQEVASD